MRSWKRGNRSTEGSNPLFEYVRGRRHLPDRKASRRLQRSLRLCLSPRGVSCCGLGARAGNQGPGYPKGPAASSGGGLPPRRGGGPDGERSAAGAGAGRDGQRKKKPTGCGGRRRDENGIMRWVWQGQEPKRRGRRDPASGRRWRPAAAGWRWRTPRSAG